MEELAEVGLAVIAVLFRLTHVRVPDTIHDDFGNLKLFGHSRRLVIGEKVPILADGLADVGLGQGLAVEELVVRLQRLLHRVKVERRQGRRRKGGSRQQFCGVRQHGRSPFLS